MRLIASIVIASVVGSLGCTGQIGEIEEPELSEEVDIGGDFATESQELQANNGLSTINGLSTLNGLGTMNGLSTLNGLGTMNGLKDGVGLMTSTSGRTTLAYLVKCALPANKRVTKKDQTGKSYTFSGGVGVAPSWETGVCDDKCQRWVTACMMAHINTTGTSLPIWVVADPGKQSHIGWTRSSTYPNQEGAFFGNIFASPPKAYYCGGRNVHASQVAGRIGAGASGAPYSNPWGSNGQCEDHCTLAPSPNHQNGFRSCNGNDAVMTVWRKATY